MIFIHFDVDSWCEVVVHFTIEFLCFFFSSIKHLRRGSDKGGVASKPPINYNPLEYDQTHPAQKQMPVEI